jgi:hypothetical protein
LPIKRIAASLLFILVIPFPALTEDSLHEMLADSRYSREEQNAIREVFDAARMEGVDDSLLLPRLKEAGAKRVPASRLVAALKKEVYLLVTARILLLESRDGKKLLREDAPLPRTANLISWGAGEDEIRSIIGGARGDSMRYLQATHLFVSLIDWGLNRTNALDLTVGAASSRINEKDFPGILDLLVRSRRGSRTPEGQSDKIIDLLSQVADFSELEERIYYE